MTTLRGMPNLSFHLNTNNGDQPFFWWQKEEENTIQICKETCTCTPTKKRKKIIIGN